uniref:non-specific serine/threonine protein kinase n=1 Tax=Mertensia paniculata TaxID=620842 RepID=A0A126WVY9_9BORA|nr:putative LOV domain-containing protein [Mertensia paniculata]
MDKHPPAKIPPLPRDHRGSLEVFNPSSSSTLFSHPSKPKDGGTFRSWKDWEAESPNEGGLSATKEEASPNTTWMAIKDPVKTQSSQHSSSSPISSDRLKIIPERNEASGAVDAAAQQRAAEWGLVLKTDTETGTAQGVQVRTSGDGVATNNNRGRNSGNSMRSSGDMSDDSNNAGNEKGLRVSEDLKDALSTFQQTFVVSDATKNDHPIMYASAGFFKMTGYSSREVVGRNCRFLQGADTNPEDVAKIREALEAETSYCGRLLNYKKDGTQFWNLLTISPIKDEAGRVLKYIGMLVEVSKHTEGLKENMMRPNGLPESLIRYDARLKEKAASSVSELVEMVKKPRKRALSESVNRPNNSNNPFLRRSAEQDRRSKAITQLELENNSNAVPPRRRHSHAGTRTIMEKISEVPPAADKKTKKPRRRSLMGLMKGRGNQDDEDDEDANITIMDEEEGEERDHDEDEEEDENGDFRPESVDDKVRKKEMRKGIDLATTLERIEKNFVITDPRLPDNPIIFASDSFLELTEYSREEILGRNCRFLQGPETDPTTVRKIREAIDEQKEVTVQLINYTKSGKKFWNLFHLQPMRDQKGEVQYFIGVQLDGSEHVEPLQNSIPVETAQKSEKLVKETAKNVDEAARELPDANTKPEDLWRNHSKIVHPKPHRKECPSWKAIQEILNNGEQIGLRHFKPIKPLGSGDTGSVHLVELTGTGHFFAMKAMDKSMMLNRNKVHRACAEREILDMLDHPFLPALYASFQTPTHICLVTDYCPGGELFNLLERQPLKVLKEDDVRFYAAEVLIALEYLHCQGIIYRDLKPENILLQTSGHIALTDFDLSCLTSCRPHLLIPESKEKKKKSHKGRQQAPIFMAEPMRASNSFVGTEEYIAPEIITGAGHTSAVDWWALGILLYEMFYGYTPFRGKTRQKTFANILHKDLKFPRRKSDDISLQAKQLIFRLLHRDPMNRLGTREGANEIKRHSFFRGINWALVRCVTPPKLEAPLFESTEEKEIDPGLQDLQNNVF